ncbi:hypothetical protein [Goodfellowiella coeruleoviolacea]|uniref:Uncharacterized protein n=1 Tax=Goodfellowiella coeruleoviolacea TaxID=334858 RepID=A0AAE3KEG9_9PSEU|nr:hypothetical protein [Goodfellowiella coeruleoviolacea]MCP2165321.1 hypothetical protein [Goodfellowiella coeruleoviolacea]
MSDHATYEQFLRTGSGTERVRLDLDAPHARVVVECRWMGLDDVPARCELRFRHRPDGDGYGRLELVAAAAAESSDAELTPVPELTAEDALLPLVVEYLRVGRTPVHVHPESQFAAMRPIGYADWNAHFDLLLLVDDGEGWPETPFWEHVRGRLDKAKLARIGPSEAR